MKIRSHSEPSQFWQKASNCENVMQLPEGKEGKDDYCKSARKERFGGTKSNLPQGSCWMGKTDIA